MKRRSGLFVTALAADLRTLDARAAERYAAATPPPIPADLPAQLERQRAAASIPTDLRAAYNAIVTLSAWSWPIWRLDGEMLPDLARTVGITVKPGRPFALFEDHPASALESFPTKLGDFSSAATYWSSNEVKSVAGSLRLYRSTLAKNVVDNADDEITTMRNLRLLEEAVFFCEAESLGLAEAAGVEWHDRRRAST